MAESFKPGDIVELKSGGPAMTVEKTGTSSRMNRPAVWVSWFDGQKKMTEVFAIEAVEMHKPPTYA